MIQAFIISIIIGISAAMIAVTINVILPNEKIANWWHRIGQKSGIKVVQGVEVERWFFRPIWGCEKCFAGQIAFWVFIYMQRHNYNLFFHLVSVCIAIMAAVIFSYHINKIKDAS